MGEKTGITWCDHTFNPFIGCTKVSAGCANCYAETQNKRYNWNPAGWGPGAPRKRTSAANWKKPIEWAKQAVRDGVLRRVFCASLADVLDPDVTQEWRNDLIDLIEDCQLIIEKLREKSGACGGLEWLLLTKRIENAAEMLPVAWLDNPPDYIRLGLTAEDQENADRRITELLKVWKGKNFISYEPALGPVDLTRIKWAKIDFDPYNYYKTYGAPVPDIIWSINNVLVSRPADKYNPAKIGINWVICGGESGTGCRPMDPQWARDLRDQCKQAGVPFFFKQTGGFPDKGHDPAGWPEDLRVQEFPG